VPSITRKPKIHSESLVLELKGTKITADTFLRATNAFFGFVNAVAEDISQQKKAVDWIVRAEPGSIRIIVEPETTKMDRIGIETTVASIKDGLRIIERSEKRPPHFDDSALGHLSTLAKLIGENGKKLDAVNISVYKKPNRISLNTYAHIQGLLGTYRVAKATVEGKLAVLSDRTGFHCFIDDILTGHPVKCEVEKEQEEEILGAFRKRIIANGEVKYRRDGQPISIKIESFRKLADDKNLPSYKDVRGILRD